MRPMRGRSDATTNEESVMTNNVELLAAYFTIAGDVYPLGPTELSPFPFRDQDRSCRSRRLPRCWSHP